MLNQNRQTMQKFVFTQILHFSIKTDDFYEDIKQDLNKQFDTSNFEENNRFNQKVLDKFKIESGHNIPIEFVGLRAKSFNKKLEFNNNEYMNKVIQKGTPKQKINKL